MLNGWTKGIPREHDLILGEESLHFWVSNTNLSCTACEELVRHTRIRVLLLDKGGYTEALGSLQRRGTSIAPDTDDHLWLEGANNISSRDQSTDEVTQDTDITP